MSSRIGLPWTSTKPLIRNTSWRSAIVGQTGKPCITIVDCVNFKNGAVEIVVIMLGQSVMVRVACGKIIFGGGIEAEQDGRVDLAFAGGYDFYSAGNKSRDVGGDAALFGCINKIGFIEYDQIRA